MTVKQINEYVTQDDMYQWFMGKDVREVCSCVFA